MRQIFRADRFLRGGDQESFQAAGYSAAIRFVEPHENFAHQHQDVRVENGIQYGDLPQYIDAQYLRRATQANVAALATLALGAGAADRRANGARALGYDSTLRWRPAADAVSYEIVWRATDAPQWEHARDVGDVTQATVPVSKDDLRYRRPQRRFQRPAQPRGLSRRGSRVVLLEPAGALGGPNRPQQRLEPRALRDRSEPGKAAQHQQRRLAPGEPAL